MLSIVALALKTLTVIAMSRSVQTSTGPNWVPPKRWCRFWFVQPNQKLAEAAILNGELDPKAQVGSEHIVLHLCLEDALRHSEMLISMVYTPMHSSDMFLIEFHWVNFGYRVYDRSVIQLDKLPRQQYGSFRWHGRIPELSPYCS